jgi:hypothetical protein
MADEPVRAGLKPGETKTEYEARVRDSRGTGEVKIKPLEAYDPLKKKEAKADAEPTQAAGEDAETYLARRAKWKKDQAAKKAGQAKAMKAPVQ